MDQAAEAQGKEEQVEVRGPDGWRWCLPAGGAEPLHALPADAPPDRPELDATEAMRRFGQAGIAARGGRRVDPSGAEEALLVLRGLGTGRAVALARRLRRAWVARIEGDEVRILPTGLDVPTFP